MCQRNNSAYSAEEDKVTISKSPIFPEEWGGGVNKISFCFHFCWKLKTCNGRVWLGLRQMLAIITSIDPGTKIHVNLHEDRNYFTQFLCFYSFSRLHFSTRVISHWLSSHYVMHISGQDMIKTLGVFKYYIRIIMNWSHWHICPVLSFLFSPYIFYPAFVETPT